MCTVVQGGGLAPSYNAFIYGVHTHKNTELYKGRHFVVNSAKNELEVLQDINDVLYKVHTIGLIDSTGLARTSLD